MQCFRHYPYIHSDQRCFSCTSCTIAEQIDRVFETNNGKVAIEAFGVQRGSLDTIHGQSDGPTVFFDVGGQSWAVTYDQGVPILLDQDEKQPHWSVQAQALLGMLTPVAEQMLDKQGITVT